MIYELVKRDPAWKVMPWCALAGAALWPWPSAFGGALLAFACLFAGAPYRRAGPFEAGLPIAARQLVVARAASLMALIWIPALAGTTAILVAHGYSAAAMKPLAVAAVSTLLAAALQSVRLDRLAGPRWTLYAIFILMPPAGLELVDHMPPVVSPLCALAGIALLAWVWAAVPRSFQLAPVKAGGEAALPARAPVTRAAMTFAWAPVLRSAYSWQYLFFVPMIGVWTSSGSWLLNPFWLLVAWWDSRARTRWLWALPVGRRALLWTIMGPMLAAHALGFYFRRPTGASSEPRVEIVTATAILVYAMLAILFIVLLDWRKLSRVPHRVRRAAFVSLLALWYLTSMALIFLAPYQELMHNGLARLAHALPLGPPALVAAAAALLLALYLAIEKVFSEPDFADKPKPQTLSETAP